MRILLTLLACLVFTPAQAQDSGAVTLDPAAVLDLAREPWRDRAGFRARLSEVLGRVDVDMPRVSDRMRAQDPFLWSLTGRFGAPLAGVAAPGGLFACSRYGLTTRDRLNEQSLSDPGAFALFGATQAAHDDAAVWPEAGLARLACMITWDDTRRVAIIEEGPATDALSTRYASVTRSGDREHYGADWQDYAPIYGERGYRLVARDGERSSVVMLEGALIELTVGHQVIRFRAFLLNGGV